jgi:antitoxin component YwqK of YwqJK toxin-antitoxin module
MHTSGGLIHSLVQNAWRYFCKNGMQFMRLGFMFVFVLWFAAPARAQYYYYDVLQSEKTADLFRKMKKAGVKKVVADALNNDGSPVENFTLLQELDSRANTLTTLAGSDYNLNSRLVSEYDVNDRIIRSTDVSGSLTSITHYRYGSAGQLISIEISSTDTVQKFSITESHFYNYLPNNQPDFMWRIKNGSDTMRIQFLPDENGMPGAEQWWKGEKKTETWFYYYNNRKQLTDIARFNARANRVLPDLLFTYDDQGSLAAQTTVQSGTTSYRIWRYTYDNRGLKTKEEVMNKNQEFEGRIVYRYE